MRGLNARDPISALEFNCQLTFPIDGICRMACMLRLIERIFVIVVPSAMDLVLLSVHVVVMVEPHVLAAMSRTYGSR